MARQSGTDFDTVKTSNRTEKQSINDKITLLKFPDGDKWTRIRPFGAIYSYVTYWCKIDPKDTSPKAKRFPVISPSWDPKTQTFDSTIYDPWLELANSQTFDKDDKDARNKQLVQIDKKFYINAISRAAQKNAPARTPKPTAAERKSGFKDKDSDTYTPWVPVALGVGLVGKIKDLKGTNTIESKKTGATKSYSVADEKYGCDILIKFDNSKAPADKYQVQRDQRIALTEEELAYPQWDLSELVTPVTDKEANRRDFEGWANRMGIKTNKKRKHEVEEFDDEELDDDVEEDEDDEDEAPKSKKKVAKKAPAKKGKKVVEEDEEEEDSDFDDEDEEDDEPVAKKGKKAPAKNGKKVVEEDEDDEDEDSDDFDDEDEDDEPPKKKGKVAAKKAPAKKGKKVVEEDEEEEDEEDEEDEDSDDFDEDESEDDDEPPAKKKAAKTPVKKRR